MRLVLFSYQLKSPFKWARSSRLIKVVPPPPPISNFFFNFDYFYLIFFANDQYINCRTKKKIFFFAAPRGGPAGPIFVKIGPKTACALFLLYIYPIDLLFFLNSPYTKYLWYQERNFRFLHFSPFYSDFSFLAILS